MKKLFLVPLLLCFAGPGFTAKAGEDPTPMTTWHIEIDHSSGEPEVQEVTLKINHWLNSQIESFINAFCKDSSDTTYYSFADYASGSVHGGETGAAVDTSFTPIAVADDAEVRDSWYDSTTNRIEIEGGDYSKIANGLNTYASMTKGKTFTANVLHYDNHSSTDEQTVSGVGHKQVRLSGGVNKLQVWFRSEYVNKHTVGTQTSSYRAKIFFQYYHAPSFSYRTMNSDVIWLEQLQDQTVGDTKLTAIFDDSDIDEVVADSIDGDISEIDRIVIKFQTREWNESWPASTDHTETIDMQYEWGEL